MCKPTMVPCELEEGAAWAAGVGEQVDCLEIQGANQACDGEVGSESLDHYWREERGI